MASLSRQFAQWVVGMRYQDLPADVVDRAKGVTLHCLTSVLMGYQSPPGRQAVKLVTEEEAGVRNGAYSEIAREPLRPTAEEVRANPRSRSAKLRWARRNNV